MAAAAGGAPPEQRLWMLLRMLRYAARNGGKPCGGSPRTGSRGAGMLRKHGAAARRRARAGGCGCSRPVSDSCSCGVVPAGRYPLVALPSLPLLLKRRKSNSPGARPPRALQGCFPCVGINGQRRTAGSAVRPLSPGMERGAQIIGKPADPNGRKGCPASKGQQNDRILYSAAADMPEHGAGVRILQNLFGLPPLFFWGQGAVFRRIFDHAGYEMVQMDPIELLEVLFRPHIHFPDIGFFRFVSLFTQLKEMRVVGRNQRFPGRLAITV